MATKNPVNCSGCAYAKKSGNGIWCPFHDVAVSSKLVCDNFLDEMDSPQWNSLANSLNNEEKKTPRFTGKDIGAYILTGFLLALGVFPLIIAVFLI